MTTVPQVAPGDDSATAIACCQPLQAERALDADDAATLAAAFKALSDPVRLQLVSLVASAAAGEACACDLPQAVDRSQSTVSHHLSILVEAGILHREQRGRWAWFTLDADMLGQLSAALVTTP
ncbi:MAG TPA: metalloregulator ArsR/SmtB family transcription factor [Nitriliruptoraceae bacterium]|nr:metalloregulator ArsR/SmtB family transcription factor [Nitriliruptoraceae bacterium]